jgi:CYTH domain-containing protein
MTCPIIWQNYPKSKSLRVIRHSMNAAWKCVYARSAKPDTSQSKLRQDDKRLERENALSKKQFEELWPATKGRRLRKIRYCVPNDGRTIEIDVYQGVSSGTIVAEVEFPDKASQTTFRKPDWLGEEVTGVAKYSNHLLAAE